MPRPIDVETLKAKIDRGDHFHLVETLLPREYESWHLPGAINIHFNRIIDSRNILRQVFSR